MSRLYRGPLQQTTDVLVGPPQQPAVHHCGRIFWLPMPVDFSTGPVIANEVIAGYTKEQDFDLILRGAWSDLTAAFVQFKTLGPDQTWSHPLRVNIQTWTGDTAKVWPMRYWRRPQLLRALEVINGDFQNVGSEEPGDVIFHGEVFGADLDYNVTRSMAFSLFCDLGGTVQPTTTAIPYDFLVQGAITNVEDTSILAKIIDDRNGWPWSNEQIPLTAMAGLETAIQPVMWFGKPYLLRANNKLRVDITTQTDGNYIEFIGEMVLRGNLV